MQRQDLYVEVCAITKIDVTNNALTHCDASMSFLRNSADSTDRRVDLNTLLSETFLSS